VTNNAAAARPVLPQLAASLIIYDASTSQTRVLMGQRHALLKFMPGFFVFPGGRVDPIDRTALIEGRFAEADDAAYGTQLIKRFARNAFAPLAASVREAEEEAGMVFRDEAGAISASAFHYLGRAVTPITASRRFDAHFFVVDRSMARVELPDPSGPDSELISLEWLSIDEANARPIAGITQRVLALLAQELPLITGKAQGMRRYGHWLRR
jgi:8-oxo-dGTP pyrophosphatase MutT (NUDIX family)